MADAHWESRMREMTRTIQNILMAVVGLIIGFVESGEAGEVRAGVSQTDISPTTFPAIRNGGFIQAVASRVDDTLYSKCLVLDDGKELVAMVVVDSCMIPTDLCDQIKKDVAGRTPLKMEKIMISATHTHSAPSVMSYCLGTSRDEVYTRLLAERVADGIVKAVSKLVPVQVGWGTIDAGEFTSNRRWITRRDKMMDDPFGEKTIRAMMHPGHRNPNYVSESGPIDPELSLIAVKEHDSGQYLCVFSNYSMHYFSGNPGFSADYFGEVAKQLSVRLEESGVAADNFVGVVSQGTSGDLYWVDYGKPSVRRSRTGYSKELTDKILNVLDGMKFSNRIPLTMAEKRLKISRRLPNNSRMAWARKLNANRGDHSPRNRPEVYAQAAQWISDNPEAEVVLQAIRIGDSVITAIPNEVYAITGLKLKMQSPVDVTMNVELANGAEGYIPPPEQHLLGGYTTWPARTAGLSTQAEPTIVENLLQLMESVTGKIRKPINIHEDPYRKWVLSTQPVSYWPLDDLSVDQARDLTGNHNTDYHGAVALFIDGVEREGMPEENRSVYFAGGLCHVALTQPKKKFSLSGYIWSAHAPVPDGTRDSIFILRSGDQSVVLNLDPEPDLTARLAFGFQDGQEETAGPTRLAPRAWNKVEIKSDGKAFSVYLNDNPQPELVTPARKGWGSLEQISFGAFDGKLDEVLLYDR